MSAFAALAGVRIVSGSFAIPLLRAWSGDVTLATADPVPADVSLTVGNLSLTGHVYRQAIFGGQRVCRVVAGFGGWRRTLPVRHYGLPGGVQLSLVLNDAALEVGEKVNVPSDRSIGVNYVREELPAARILNQLADDEWYIDNSGVTQIAAWPTRKIPSPFTAVSQDGGSGVLEIATEDYAAWMPNATFASPFLDGTYTVGGVRFAAEGDGQLRLQVMTSGGLT